MDERTTLTDDEIKSSDSRYRAVVDDDDADMDDSDSTDTDSDDTDADSDDTDT